MNQNLADVFTVAQVEALESVFATSEMGLIDAVILREQATSPAKVGGQGKIYTKDVSGSTELFFDGGTEIQLTPLPVGASYAIPANKVGIGALSEGVATDSIRSDVTFTIDESIAPTWSGEHEFQGGVIVDRNSAEALLVRRASDGGDRFIVDTSGASDGLVGINMSPVEVLDIAGSAGSEAVIRCTGPAPILANDGVIKNSRMRMGHYTYAEQDVTMFLASSTTNSATVEFGGGSIEENAVTAIRFWSASNNTTTKGSCRFRIWNSGRIALGDNVESLVPLGQVHIKTTSSIAREVLTLDQQDADRPFVDYRGTSAADATKSISTLTAGNTVQGFLRDEVNGSVVWTPYYDAPTRTGQQASDKSWSFASPAGGGATFYVGGFYVLNSGNSDFSSTQTIGNANEAHAAHAFVVLGAATADTITLTVSGTSITDGGVRTTSDTEVITITHPAAANDYFETSKKWLGQVSIDLTSGTGRQCNWGLCKYWDNSNSDFTVTGFDITWLGGANDNSPDIELLHHKASGWTYNAGSTPTPPTALAQLTTDYATDDHVDNDRNGAYKRTNLSTAIDGDSSEGTIWRITTSVANTFRAGTIVMQIENA